MYNKISEVTKKYNNQLLEPPEAMVLLNPATLGLQSIAELLINPWIQTMDQHTIGEKNMHKYAQQSCENWTIANCAILSQQCNTQTHKHVGSAEDAHPQRSDNFIPQSKQQPRMPSTTAKEGKWQNQVKCGLVRVAIWYTRETIG